MTSITITERQADAIIRAQGINIQRAHEVSDNQLAYFRAMLVDIQDRQLTPILRDQIVAGRSLQDDGESEITSMKLYYTEMLAIRSASVGTLSASKTKEFMIKARKLEARKKKFQRAMNEMALLRLMIQNPFDWNKLRATSRRTERGRNWFIPVGHLFRS